MKAPIIKNQKKVKKFEKGTKAYAKDRVRKEGRYSALNTMAMRLLKDYKVYKISKEIAQNNQINSQKNYSILVFRLSIAYSKITFFYHLAQQKAVNKIFHYMQKDLENLAYKKFKKNDETYKQAVIESSKKDISALKYVFEGDLNDKGQIKRSMFSLFSFNKNGNYTKNQKDSVEALTEIVFQYTKYFDEHQQTMGMQDGQNQVLDSDDKDDMDQERQNEVINGSYQISHDNQNIGNDNGQDIELRSIADSEDSFFAFIKRVMPADDESDFKFGTQIITTIQNLLGGD